MDFKSLIDFSNGIVVSMIDSLEKMGLDSQLIMTQISDSLTNKANNFLVDAGLDIKGNNVDEISKSFSENMKSTGVCKRVNVLETSDSKVVIDIGECIFAPTTHMLRKNDVNFIPPCPMMAILTGKIESTTGKRSTIESCKWIPQENTSIFTINLE